MSSNRKLRKQLTYEVGRLNVMRRAMNPNLDAETGRIVATQLRDQARLCLSLVDEYQASAPKRLQTWAAKECQPLRDELEGTVLLFDIASGTHGPPE
jgi:hypothetical protein